jgi:hypothetical protein
MVAHTASGALPRAAIPKEMIIRKLVLLATAAAMLCAGVAGARADSLGRRCTSTAQDQWLSIDALQTKIEALGYKVQKAKLKNACAELYALDKTGARVELFVDPTNGEIIGKL